MLKIISLLRRVNLFKRLMIAFLIITILPTTLLNFFSYSRFTKEIESSRTNLVFSVMDNVEALISDSFRKYENLSYNIYSNKDIISLLKSCNSFIHSQKFMSEKYDEYEHNKSLIGQYMYALTATSPYISNIQIITPYDQFNCFNPSGIQTSGYIKNLNTFINSDYYLYAIEAKGYPVWFDTTKVYDVFFRITNPIFGIADTLTMTQAILDPYTSTPLGVAVINVNANFLLDVLHGTKNSFNGNLLLVSPNGPIRSLYSEINAPPFSKNPDILFKMMNSSSGSLLTSINNVACFLVYRQLPNTEFYLVNVLEYSQLIQNAHTIVVQSFKMIFIWIIIALIISYLVTLSVSNPIAALKKTMNQVSLDQLDIQADVDSQDEVGMLSLKFNEMTNNLQDLFHKVYLAELKQKDLAFQKKNSELNALQMQINPHFLYNTLDIIRWESMYQENGEGKVSRMISDFSTLLRLGTKNNADFVSIAEEIKHVDAYMKVINYRYNNSIMLTTHFSFNTADYIIPKLTLQPLIENAILHGFDGFDGDKNITLSGEFEENYILIHIGDTGKGMTLDELTSLHANLNNRSMDIKSIGIYNINDRLKLYFGDNYVLTLTSTLNIGTTISLRLPQVNDYSTLSQ